MDSMKLGFNILWFAGVWKPVDRSYEVLYFLRQIILVPAPFLFASLFGAKLILDEVELDEFTEVFYIFATVINVCCKSLSLLSQGKNIDNLTKLLKKNIALPQDAEEKYIYNEYHRFISRLMLISVSFIETTAILFMVQPFFQDRENRTLPFNIYIPWNYSSDEKFWITFIMQGVLALTCSSISPALNAIIYGYMIQVCGQFDILSHRFAKLPDCNEKSERDMMLWNIKHHKFIYEFMEKFQQTFNGVLKFQFILFSIVITMSVYQVSMMSSIDLVFFTRLMYSLGMVADFFCFCWFSNEVTLKSQEFTDMIFSTDWYRLSIHTRKDIRFVLFRSCKPIIISNGLNSDFSINSFMKVMKISYSVFNILRKSV